MSMAPSHPSVKLSKSCTVSRYRDLIAAKNQALIADFIVERFEERYFDPIEIEPRKKNGFTIMAVSCLMVETLESFRRGWPSSQGKSELAFCSFFSTWDDFADFRPVSGDFYKHVRCGILHQAETTGGWRILRSGPLRNNTTVNATKFARTLRGVLHNYASSLRTEDWNSSVWQAFRKKMQAVCRNAEGT